MPSFPSVSDPWAFRHASVGPGTRFIPLLLPFRAKPGVHGGRSWGAAQKARAPGQWVDQVEGEGQPALGQGSPHATPSQGFQGWVLCSHGGWTAPGGLDPWPDATAPPPRHACSHDICWKET